MAWLSRLDARSARWPRPVRWLYLAAKWYLIAGGALLCVMLARQELLERRVGLGVGVVTVGLFATIKGTITALRLLRGHSPDPHP